MKKSVKNQLFSFLFLSLFNPIFGGIITAQSITLDPKNTANPSIVDIKSNNKGILLPKVADPASNIANPASGLMAYNTTTNTPNFYNGSQWQSVTAVSAASMGFKNMVVFDASAFTRNWTVPAGVNKIMIEGWAGGGGGKFYDYSGAQIIGNGAGAGAYGKKIMDVTPGQILNIDVGLGGNAQTQSISSGNGYDTYFTISGVIQFYLSGGSRDGRGGITNRNYFIFGVSGENGKNVSISYEYLGAAGHNDVFKLGDGGNAYNGGTGGKGDWFVSLNSNTYVYGSAPSNNLDGGTPGGGGGCGYNLGTNSAGYGGNGMVIIYY